MFPFKFKGTTYSECTSKGSSSPWCSTSTTADGSYNGKYGTCDMDACDPSKSIELFATLVNAIYDNDVWLI